MENRLKTIPDLTPPPELIRAVQAAGTFLLVTHIGPDGDAVGSTLGLAHVLRGMGRKVDVLDVDPVPRTYHFLPGCADFLRTPPDGEPDLLLLLDCGDLERTGFPALPGRNRAVIDHHLTQRDFGDVRWVVPGASSTGEMVYQLTRAITSTPFSVEAAVCLYTAIFTDTGGFRYASATPSSYRAAADLVESGVDPWTVTEAVHESVPPERMALMGKTLAGLRMHGPVSVLSVTEEMYRETGTSAEDTENFSNLARGMRGVEVGVFLRQVAPTRFKVSMRSKGRVNVAAIAETLGGGGHHNAAGGVIDGALPEAENRVVALLHDALRNSQPE